jgi:hypothetical protein
MTKYSFILLPLLFSCHSIHHAALGLDATEQSTSDIPHIPLTIARGTDGINEYSCSDLDVSNRAVVIECDFQNTWEPVVAGNSTDNTCLRVRFYRESNMSVVAESKQICSGNLKAKQKSVKYVAFQDSKTDHSRRALDECGAGWERCVMLAETDYPKDKL